MKTTKMSLANIQGKLSRAEMKNIMAGSDYAAICKSCTVDTDCAWDKVCRSSPSCPDPKVCAKPLYA